MGIPGSANPLLFGGEAQAYEIEQSLRFNKDDSNYMERTFSSSGSLTTWTFSCWFKFGRRSQQQTLWSAGTTFGVYDYINFSSNAGTYKDNLEHYVRRAGAAWRTSAKYRDHSAWYHVVAVWDTTNATAADRLRHYINGVRVDSYSASGSIAQNATSMHINTANKHRFGLRADSNTSYTGQIMDGHMAELHFIDGTAVDPEDNFGEFDENGVWRPIEYTGSYGSNGVYLKFDSTATNGIGHDHSGNGNNFTPTSGFTTSGTGTDVLDDTPTTNFPTFNPLALDRGLNDANLVVGTGHGNADFVWTKTMAANQGGNYYWEYNVTSVQASSDFYFGVLEYTSPIHRLPDWPYGVREKALIFNCASTNTQWRVRDSYVNSNAPSGGFTVAANDVVGVRIDIDNDLVTLSKNGTVETGISGYLSSDTNVYYTPAADIYGNNDQAQFNAGQRAFSHQPTGTSELSTATLAEVDILNPADHFQVVLDTGANILSSAQSATTGFSSGLWWIKDRDNANNNQIFDTASTSSSVLLSPANGRASYSAPSGNSVAWCWAAPSSSASNTNGSITTSVYANDTAGFSIATWSGTGANATVGHGFKQCA